MKNCSLKDYKNESEHCQLCSISKSRNKVVFGTGDEKANIMFIGEAPGETEDRIGQPFVGKAGEVFSDLLKIIGMSRSQIYLTNSI